MEKICYRFVHPKDFSYPYDNNIYSHPTIQFYYIEFGKNEKGEERNWSQSILDLKFQTDGGRRYFWYGGKLEYVDVDGVQETKRVISLLTKWKNHLEKDRYRVNMKRSVAIFLRQFTRVEYHPEKSMFIKRRPLCHN